MCIRDRQGLTRGAQGENILLDRCRVSWTGPSPRTDPPGGREAVRAARSLEVCLLPLLVDEQRRGGVTRPDGKPSTEATFRQMYPQEAQRLEAAEKSARAELAAQGLTALSCEHPLIHLLKRCERGSTLEREGAECASRYVVEIRDLLPH